MSFVYHTNNEIIRILRTIRKQILGNRKNSRNSDVFLLKLSFLMPDFSPTYIRSIYLERCKEPEFPINLKKPTEARIRSACINTYAKKNSASDKSILRNFLDVSEEKDLVIALRRATGKFRPVVNFLKNETDDPREETIGLIAWLIDLNFDGAEQIIEPGNSGLEATPLDQSPNKPSPPKNILGISNRAIRNIITLLTLFIGFISISGVDMIMPYKRMVSRNPQPNEKCMYWNGNYYEPISCNDTIFSSKKIIPLQLKELVNLKRNDNPDTLTISDLGKTWYRKLDNTVYLYTSAGRFPLDTSKTLKPLTERIFNYHLLNKYSRLDKWMPLVYLVTSISLLTYSIDYSIAFWIRRKHKKQSR